MLDSAWQLTATSSEGSKCKSCVGEKGLLIEKLTIKYVYFFPLGHFLGHGNTTFLYARVDSLKCTVSIGIKWGLDITQENIHSGDANE